MTGDKLPNILTGISNGSLVIDSTTFNNHIQWNYPGQCHGCSGRGWVETSDLKPHKCPVCEGKGKYSEPFSPIIQPSPWQPTIPQYPTYPQYPWSPVIISTSDKSNSVPVISGTSIGNVTNGILPLNTTFTKHSTGL